MNLVTGGTGFLGSWLIAALLERGEPVRLFCRSAPTNDLPFSPKAVDVALGDLLDRDAVKRAFEGVRRVYHVAGRVDFNPSAEGRRLLLAINEQGTQHVLEAANAEGVERVVHVSSVSTIGATSDPARLLSEDDFGRGLGVDLPYPDSKRRGELVALDFAARGLPVVVCNPTFFAGPGDRNLSSARTIVSFLKRQVWVGLTRGGFGYTDVRDVASGLIAAMEHGVPGRRYILGGHNLRLHEYHALLERLTGLRAPRLRLPPRAALVLAVIGRLGYRLLGIKTHVAAGDVRLAQHYWLYDYSRARNELGLVCRSPEESLRDAVAWLERHGYPIPRRKRAVPG